MFEFKSDYLDLAKILDEPEVAYPENFDTPAEAAALLMCLCQTAAEEIRKLRLQIVELHSAK